MVNKLCIFLLCVMFVTIDNMSNIFSFRICLGCRNYSAVINKALHVDRALLCIIYSFKSNIKVCFKRSVRCVQCEGTIHVHPIHPLPKKSSEHDTNVLFLKGFTYDFLSFKEIARRIHHLQR